MDIDGLPPERMAMKDGPGFQRRVDWNLFKVFHEIVRSGGITRAAEEISRKQSSVSLALKRLEEQLGVKLCTRGPSGFALTDEGQIIAEACETLSSLVAAMPSQLQNIGEQLVGRIYVRMIGNIVCDHLDRAIGNFHALHPYVEIAISISTWDTVAGSLLREEADIGISPVRHFRADLSYHLLFEEVHRPYCGRNHPLFGKTFQHPAELKDHAFVLTGADEPDQLTAYRIAHGMGSRIAGISDSPEEAMRLAKLGLGICFLPEGLAASAVAQGELSPLLGSGSAPRLSLYVITNPAAQRHAARDRFVQEILAQTPAAPQH
jgi:LysR family transcriptional regulator, transcriptional activator for bauABCD operon